MNYGCASPNIECNPNHLIKSFLTDGSCEVRKYLDLELFLQGTKGIEFNEVVTNEICSLYNGMGACLKGLNLATCLSNAEQSDCFILNICEKCGSSLENLCLRGCCITHVGLRAVSIHCSKNLHTLNLVDCTDFIDDKSLKIIASLGRTLETLNLSGCRRVSNDGICLLAQTCVTLRKLYLNNCNRLSERGCKALGHFCSKTLTSLHLCGCINVDDKSVSFLMKRCGLVEFRISDTQMILGQWKKVYDPNLLKTLMVSNCQNLQSEAYVTFSQFIFLEKVDVSRSKNLDTHFLTLMLTYCCNILHLNISGCDLVNNEALKVVSMKCPHILHLNIANCHKISEEGFNELLVCIELSSVDCSDCSCIKKQYLDSIAPKLVFSKLVITREFFGFQEKPNAEELRKKSRIRRLQGEKALVIQKVFRGFSSRRGIIKQAIQNSLLRKVIPRIQARFRGRVQKLRWVLILHNHRETCSAIMIQSAWRRKLCQRLLHKHMVVKRQISTLCNAATRIQKYYRCYQSCLLFNQLRYVEKLNRKMEMEKFRTCCNAAIIIQSFGRKWLCQNILSNYKKDRNEQLLLSNLKFRKALLIQCFLRGLFARKKYLKLKIASSYFKAKLFIAQWIQCRFQGRKARQLILHFRESLIAIAQEKAVLILQRIFRQFISKQYAEMLLAKKQFLMIKNSCALQIQNIVRQYLASLKIKNLRKEKEREQEIIDAVATIQRVFRGNLGRLQFAIFTEFEVSKSKFIPIESRISSIECTLLEKQNKLQDIKESLSLKKRHMIEIENELKKVVKSGASYHDSCRFMGFSQRYKVSILEKLLGQEVKSDRVAINSLEVSITSLKVAIRKLEGEMRSKQRCMASLKFDLESKVKASFQIRSSK